MTGEGSFSLCAGRIQTESLTQRPMKRMNTLTKSLLTGVFAASFTAIVPAALAERDDVRGKKGKGNVKWEKSHHVDSLAEDKRGDARRGGPPQKGGPDARRGGPPQRGGPAQHHRGHRR